MSCVRQEQQQQRWNISSRVQRRQVHKRRRKKLSKMSPLIESVAASHQISQFCSQFEATKSNAKHRLRPMTMFKFAWFMLTITQLLCDMAQVESFGPTPFGLSASGAEQKATSSDLDAASSEPARPFQVDETQSDKQQRFLDEPRDTFAVVGQPEVSFTCQIYAQHGAGSWKRASRRQLSAYNLNILDDEEKMWTTLEKLPMLNKQQQSERDNNSAQNSHQAISRPDDELLATNYTLHIKNVTLANDDHYQCMVAAADLKTQPEIKSRQARLSVLKPPTRLDLRSVRISSSDGTEIDLSGPIPHDTPTSNLIENSITSEDANRQAPVRVVELEDGERLRLECRTSSSKPRANIVWLDQDSSPRPIDDEMRDSVEPYFETRFELESNQLERTISTIALKVDREKHHEKLFACSTQHLAYELASNGSLPESIATSLQPLRQFVKLSVIYKPRVQLAKDQNNPVEGLPLKFSCLVDARPAIVNISWFVDEQQIEGAHESDLFIGSLTRQLHLREIKCVASNRLGSGSALIRLAVKYSPAYVTHLLPPSLQPDYSSAIATKPTAGKQSQDSFLSAADQSVSREMAVGVDDGRSITLRCDFDSNPGPSQIQWFKIASEYSTVSEVTSAEADEFMASGGNEIQFKGRAREVQRTMQNPIYYDSVQVEVKPTKAALISATGDYHGNKRHIINEETQGFGSTVLEEDPQNQDQMEQQVQTRSVSSSEPNRFDDHLPKSYELDYERMSHSLMRTLAGTSERDETIRKQLEEANLTESAANLQPLVQQLERNPTSQTNSHKIHEPLAFFMHRRKHLLFEHSANRNLSSNSAGQRFAELVLLDRIQTEPADSSSSPNKTLPRNNASNDRRRWSRALLERQAQMTTSSLSLTNFNIDSIGRYVCLAKAADGFQDQARAIFVVLRQSPRIISERRQLAPLGAPQLLAECLAQINTVHDNQTRIQWFKDGKLIVQSAGSPRNITIKQEVSPDALYMRSTLTINGAQNLDFGQYTCNISNSLGTDSMQILLQPTASSGLLFQTLACVVGLTVVLFAIAIAILFSITLGKRSSPTTGNGKSSSSLAILKGGGKKVAVVLAAPANEQGGKLAAADSRQPPPPPPPLPGSDRGSSSPSGHSNHSTTKRSINSSEASTTITRQLLEVELEAIAQSQRHAMMMMMQKSHPNQSIAEQRQQQITRPESALGTSGAFYLDSNQEQHYSSSTRGRFARTSLRSDRQTSETRLERSRNATLNPGQLPSNHNKFAAIHETLEHKLHFGGAGGALNLMATPPSNNQEDQQPDEDSSPDKLNDDSKPIKNSAGFVDRIRNRFKSQAPTTLANNLRSKHNSLGRNSGKSRPTISMPIGDVVSGGRRSSLSNSLTLVNDQNQTAALPVSLGGNQQSKHSIKMQLNHISGGVDSNLVSSKANLIQDSGTASDGTTSSGRSSINSNNPNGHLHRQAMAVKLMGPHQDQAYLLNQVGPGYAQQQLWANAINQQAIGQLASNCDENILYANSSNLYDLANDQQQYANGYHGPYGQYQQPHPVVYAPSQLDDFYKQQQQQIFQETNERYQMPVLMSEPYLEAAAAAAAVGAPVQQQDATRPCYATICNGVNKSPPRQQEHQQMGHNGPSLNGVASYGTLPARVHFEHHHHQPQHQQPMSMTTSNSPNLVQHPHLEQSQQTIMCSVSDEAAFESNYGTLLSKSSAYKTLGYDQLPPKEVI